MKFPDSFYPSILDYLALNASSYAVEGPELEDIISFVCSKVPISREVAKLVVRNYFEVARLELMQGRTVYLSFAKLRCKKTAVYAKGYPSYKKRIV